ncbi:MAG TPA: hypothetical protein VLC98_16705 [Phnomibacter sp.]|nr:hypothetical protein [Phnomibacter sp.]
MNQEPNSFSLEYNGRTLQVEKLNLPGYRAYRVSAEGSISLIVARAKDFEAHHFWTSIPEGRQVEAERVGAVVEEYLRAKNYI